MLPRLAASVDPSGLDLSPAEGFLLSRIDGRTPWSVLRQIGGLSPEDVDARLAAWQAEGVIELVDPKSQRPKRRLAPGEIDEDALDDALDIDVTTQRRILEFEANLGRSYHELLGVARDADAKDIKRAYFKLSKEFHPDRYFRREIGGYAKRLERIFKRILEAHELLSDPTARAEIEKSMSAAGQSPPPVATPPPDASTSGAPPAPRALTKLERLRARMPFKLPESVLAERRQRAREFFEAAQRELAHNRFIEAAQTIRLAIAFDPFEDAYRERFGEVQARAAELRAEALVAEAEAASASGIADEKRYAQVLRLYEDALLYRPHDPNLNDRASRAAIQCKQLTKAVEYAETALEHSPEVAQHHVTMALVHRARGNKGHAIKSLEQALELDRNQEEARKLLASLRRTAGPGA